MIFAKTINFTISIVFVHVAFFLTLHWLIDSFSKLLRVL